MLDGFLIKFDYPGKRPINHQTAKVGFELYLDHPALGCLLLEENSKIAAVMGYIIMRHPWNGIEIFHKAFWYSRKPGAGRKLLKHIIDMCKERNIEQVHIGSMHPIVDRLLIRNGFKPSETNYILEL